MALPILEAPKPPAPKPGRMRGPEFRIGQVRHIFDYLPPWTMSDLHGVVAHLCGRCFQRLPDDPFGGKPGGLRPGAPQGSRCAFCGRKAHPCD